MVQREASDIPSGVLRPDSFRAVLAQAVPVLRDCYSYSRPVSVAIVLQCALGAIQSTRCVDFIVLREERVISK